MDCIQSKRRNRLGPIMFQDLVFVYDNTLVIKQMVEHEKVRTGVWVPVECEADVEPDTETELSSDDEYCIL